MALYVVLEQPKFILSTFDSTLAPTDGDCLLTQGVQIVPCVAETEDLDRNLSCVCFREPARTGVSLWVRS